MLSLDPELFCCCNTSSMMIYLFLCTNIPHYLHLKQMLIITSNGGLNNKDCMLAQ